MKQSLFPLIFCLFILFIQNATANPLTIGNDPPCNNPPVISEITVQDNFLNSGIPNDDATCHGGDLAFGANIEFNTGQPPYSFLWSASPAANVVFVDNTASYTGANFTNTANAPVDVELTVVVTDAAGCTGSGSVTVSVSPQYTLDIIRTENSGTPNDGGVCFGDVVTFEASLPQSGTFTYTWQEEIPPGPPQLLPNTTPSITVAPPYNNQNTVYLAAVTDAFGCSVSGFGSAKGLEEIVVNSFFKPACTPGDPDSIRVEVSGGATSTGNYLYDVSTLPLPEFHEAVWTFPVFVPPGTLIHILVIDEKGCSGTSDIILPAPPPFLSAVATATATSCTNNGTMDLTPSGGTPPYQFLWSNNQTTEDLAGLPAGIYTCTVTDVNGCTAMAAAAVILIPDLVWYADTDGDGFGDPGVSVTQCEPPAGFVANSGDCDDNNSSIYPGVTETCNNVDDNCNGQVDEGLEFTNYYPDTDADGFGDMNASPVSSCNPVPGYVWNNFDCDDGDFNINPSAAEICDGFDNNCNGQVDENAGPAVFYQDLDSDGYGNPAVSVTACTAPTGFVLDNTDCNDQVVTANPGAAEVCDGIDNNCDGQIDEGLQVTYYFDQDGDGFGNDLNALTLCITPPPGYIVTGGDCNDGVNTIYPGAPEICNGVDDDCDGQVDENSGFTWYADTDGDGYGNSLVSQISCTQPTGYVPNADDCNDTNSAVNPAAAELCNGIDDNCNGQVDEGAAPQQYWSDNDHDGYGEYSLGFFCIAPPNAAPQPGDCNDWNAAVHPGAAEICNWLDDDCDGQMDEGVQTTYYVDGDGDGFGNPNISTQSCFPPAGHVSNNLDCNDNIPTIHPGAPEICDGFDNNCNGQVDDGLTFLQYWSDNDHDGYGQYLLGSYCAAPPNSATQPGDCNDWNAAIHPGAVEICNWQDDDCDGQVDEGAASVFYLDADGDGFGNPNISTTTCFAPGGYVVVGGDCNDYNPTIHPGASEICDGFDNNCNGQADEGLNFQQYWSDNDQDGYGQYSLGTFCSPPPNSATQPGDCNDWNAAIHPGAAEICNWQDDDCDGQVDEGAGSLFYQDADGDGYGNPNVSTTACYAPWGYVANNTDCNDNPAQGGAAIHPGAPEICDGLDNNCDGLTDNVSGPDLIVFSANAPGAAMPGQSITVSGVIKNKGTAFAGTNRVRWYLSHDANLGAGDYSPSSWYRSTNNINAGASKSFSRSITLPSSGWNGQKYLIFFADQLNQVPEGCENNNLLVLPITIGQALVGQNNPGKGSSFSAVKVDRSAKMSWLVYSDKKIEKMTIERSADGVDFQTLIELDEKVEANQVRTFKEMDDATLAGSNFYRIRFIRDDGSEEFSTIESIFFEEISGFEIFPNPAESYVNVYMENLLGKEDIDLVVFDRYGREVLRSHLPVVEQKIFRIDLGRPLFSDGLYLVSVVYRGRVLSKALAVMKQD